MFITYYYKLPKLVKRISKSFKCFIKTYLYKGCAGQIGCFKWLLLFAGKVRFYANRQMTNNGYLIA